MIGSCGHKKWRIAVVFDRAPQSGISSRFSVVHKRCILVQRLKHTKLKGLILAQNERWRHGLGMQVAREVSNSLLGEADSGERESNAWLLALETGIALGNWQ